MEQSIKTKLWSIVSYFTKVKENKLFNLHTFTID